VSYPHVDAVTIDRYLTCLKKELAESKQTKFDTIYIGGGTPSMLSFNQLRQLMDMIKPFMNKSVETTVESNPDSLDRNKLLLLKQSGINRLSIGLQSFNNELLITLGRVHTVDKFMKTYVSARNIGFENVSIDLIYGTPGQTLAGWKQELKSIVGLGPEHVSVYGLTIEPDTKLAQDKTVLDDDLLADMYEQAMDYLAESGYEQYEISNFAKTAVDNTRCRHNQVYWHNGQYLGIGASAVSYLKGTRNKNSGDLVEYISHVETGTSPVIESETLDPQKKLVETVILGLRLVKDGIELTKPQYDLLNEKFITLESDGLVKRDNNHVWLTRRGILLSNHVFRELL
jgi:oxygen-independent coproporphyrinogen-3 oxidase